MLAAAVPPWFDARVAHEALGLAGAEHMLAWLDDGGLLATSPDGGRRFQPFVRGFLLHTLAGREPRRVAGPPGGGVRGAGGAGGVGGAFELAVAGGRVANGADLAR